MREFALTFLLMLLVAHVVISQNSLPIIDPPIRRIETSSRPALPITDTFSDGDHQVGHKSYFYSYAKVGQNAVLMPNEHPKLNVGTRLIRRLASLYNRPDFKPIIKKMIRLSAEKLAAMVGNSPLHNRPDRVLQITVKENYLRMKQLWNNLKYTLCPESNLDFFVKEYGDRFTFDSLSDDIITSVIHRESKWLKMK